MTESAFAVYLRSVERLYPGGIPRALFAEARKRTSSSGSVLFLSCEPGESGVVDPFQDAAGELLRGAIEKGLQIDLAEAQVLRSADPEEIASVFSASKKPFVVLLGAKAAAAAGIQYSGAAELVASGCKQVLCTVELSKSVQDAAAKRRFWHDLQILLSALRPRG